MKRTGYLWDHIFTYDNFLYAIEEASKGKKDRRIVNKVLENPKHYYDIIIKNPFDIGHYTPKIVVDQSSMKKRQILILAFFPDQVLHHMIIQVIYPILMKGAYVYSCASIKKKGQLYASMALRRGIKKSKRRLYWFKADVHHFYPSIDHDILKEKLSHKIKDERVLKLLGAIIDSCEEGIPIGNYTSQILSNFYLQDFDHFIKEKLKIETYVRYMDDMVLVSQNKRKLTKALSEMQSRLHNEYRLETHDDETVYMLNDFHPIDFVGYRHYKDHTTIRKRVFKHMRTMAIRMKENNYSLIRQKRRTASYLGYVKHSDSKMIAEKYSLRKENIRNEKQVLL